MTKPVIFISGSIALTILLGSLTVGASSATPQPKEWVKYLNPLPHKNYSLNESQDREIKKKGFKTVTITGAKPVSNRELGFFATLSTAELLSDLSGGAGEINKLLDRTDVSGISVLIPWNLLEPQEEKYDFSKIDQLLQLCKQKNKTLILRISTAGADESQDSDTPSWVFASDTKSITYKGSDGKDHKMPIFWDSSYLAKWGNFVAELGRKYDKNESLHSVGITGGGILGGTEVVPDLISAKERATNKDNYKTLETTLMKEHGMSQRQLVEHWKYVADIFPKAFPHTRLNFDIDPPTPNRAGQDSLDEISDYLIYRYGQRIYLTRQGISDAKHGFDQYRVLLKFHGDTLTGYQLTQEIKPEELVKLVKNAAEDGISYVELPASIIRSDKEPVSKALQDIRGHLGYQLVSQKVALPTDIKAGDPLKASFTFLNLGAASPMRPVRELDKDVASSFKLQIELRDSSGKPVALLMQTPTPPTNQWKSGKSITWEGELKTPAKLKPGEYEVFLSLVEPDTKRKLQMLNGLSTDPVAESSLNVGKLKVQ